MTSASSAARLAFSAVRRSEGPSWRACSSLKSCSTNAKRSAVVSSRRGLRLRLRGRPRLGGAGNLALAPIRIASRSAKHPPVHAAVAEDQESNLRKEPSETSGAYKAHGLSARRALQRLAAHVHSART